MLALLPEGWTSALMVMALCFLCGTDVISAPSISLEGKTLWLLKSLPVTPRVILMSKVKTHVAVALPVTLIASVCCILALTMTPLRCALVIVIPALMTLFGALLGVVVNLRFPKFDYINETAVIKNSMAVMITMFASWGVLAAPVALYVVLLDNVIGMVPYMCLCAVALAAACAAMYVYLGRGGAKTLCPAVSAMNIQKGDEAWLRLLLFNVVSILTAQALYKRIAFICRLLQYDQLFFRKLVELTYAAHELSYRYGAAVLGHVELALVALPEREHVRGHGAARHGYALVGLEAPAGRAG